MLASPRAILVRKANGEREPFYADKLYRSLVQSGADRETAERITSRVADSILEGDRTQDIYRRAFASLRKVERPVAARYSVKHALLELGPSGYPFEDYLAEIYRVRGYSTSTRLHVQGRCVEHEIDLVGVRGGERFGAEVKYHNNASLKSDIKVALYVQARFEDILAQTAHAPYTARLLITNTKFTEQAEVYGACVGMELVSWDYPNRGNLRELIEETGVHPISCITSLSRTHKRTLMDQGIVLCRQVGDHVAELESMGLSPGAISAVLEESATLCVTPVRIAA